MPTMSREQLHKLLPLNHQHDAGSSKEFQNSEQSDNKTATGTQHLNTCKMMIRLRWNISCSCANHHSFGPSAHPGWGMFVVCLVAGPRRLAPAASQMCKRLLSRP